MNGLKRSKKMKSVKMQKNKKEDKKLNGTVYEGELK